MAKILELSADNEAMLCEIGKALSSEVRIQMLKLLYYNSYNVSEISKKIDIPPSSAALHIRMLESANLINTELQPGNRGSMKLCSRKHDFINIRLVGEPQNVKKTHTIQMPVGAYSDCDVSPTCGIASATEIIGSEDRPSHFFLPERAQAQLVWSSKGYVEYKFPNPVDMGIELQRLILSFEACSEAPNYQEDWKSDITIWINGIECATWHSPGDFGARRGRLTPSWWDSGATQYGLLVTLEISEETTLNNRKASYISISDLELDKQNAVTVRIGNKKDAKYCGGFNIFGKCFGDYEQDIALTFVY